MMANYWPHLLAMLVATQVVAGSLCRGLRHRAFPTETAGTLLLALTGVMLISLP